MSDKMNDIQSEVMEQVLALYDRYDFSSFTQEDVRRALDQDSITFEDYAALLSVHAIGKNRVTCVTRVSERIVAHGTIEHR